MSSFQFDTSLKVVVTDYPDEDLISNIVRNVKVNIDSADDILGTKIIATVRLR